MHLEISNNSNQNAAKYGKNDYLFTISDYLKFRKN